MISNGVNHGGLLDVLGAAGATNVQGEEQKKMDVLSNEIFLKRNDWAGHLAAMASEEMDEVYQIPAGKLRLMYEANPMSFIVEQAGGAATTGRERILDLQSAGIHHRVPVVLGSRNEVERITGHPLETQAAA